MPTLSLLPGDILLIICHFTDVDSALSLVQTCKLLYAMANTKTFWLVLVQRIRLSRPIPIRDPSQATLGALRRAILQARALESKFFIYGEDTTVQYQRWRKLDPLPSPEPDIQLDYDDAFVTLLTDRQHILQEYTGALCIRDVFSGHTVAWIPFKGDNHFHYDGVYKGRAVIGVLSMVKSKLLLQVWEIPRLEEELFSRNIDRKAMDFTGCEDYIYILIQPRGNPDMVFLEVINWVTRDSNRLLISSMALDLASAKCGITDDHFLIHLTWGDRLEVAFFDLDMVNSPLTRASIIPLKPKYSCSFSFADGRVNQLSEVDIMWDDRICSSTVQPQQDSNTQILTLAELDVSPNADESDRLTTTLRRSAHLMEDPYGNHILHPGRHGKTPMWTAHSDEGEDDVGFIIKFAGRPGLADVRDSKEIRVLSFIPPDFVHRHGVLYDTDFDDAYGRLLLYMEDGTIFIFEFI